MQKAYAAEGLALATSRFTQSDPRLVDGLEAMIDAETRGAPRSPLGWTRKSTGAAADGPRIATFAGNKNHVCAVPAV
jgi:hypothetical protein